MTVRHRDPLSFDRYQPVGVAAACDVRQNSYANRLCLSRGRQLPRRSQHNLPNGRARNTSVGCRQASRRPDKTATRRPCRDDPRDAIRRLRRLAGQSRALRFLPGSDWSLPKLFYDRCQTRRRNLSPDFDFGATSSDLQIVESALGQSLLRRLQPPDKESAELF